jgi:hypothetical protein
MNLTPGMTKKQLILFALVVLALIATTLVVAQIAAHAAMPALWHAVGDSPDILNWHP